MEINCRLCARACSSDNSKPIFSFHRNWLILDLISIFCPIKIEKSDNLPQEICEICLKHIENAYELREKSVRIDINLRSANLDLSKSKNQVCPATASKSDKVAQMITIKQENPLEIPTVIEFNETLGETSNFDMPDQQDEDEEEFNSDEYESDFLQPQRRRKRKFKKRQPNVPLVESNNKPVCSKYVIVNGRYKCPLCVLTFSHSNTVPKHIRKCHSDENPETFVRKSIGSISCNYCDEKFANMANRKRHMNRKHPDIPYDSEPKKFKSSLNEPNNTSDSDSSTSSMWKINQVLEGLSKKVEEKIHEKN